MKVRDPAPLLPRLWPHRRHTAWSNAQALKMAIEKDGYYLWAANAVPSDDELRLMR
jgi:hypothetical protein